MTVGRICCHSVDKARADETARVAAQRMATRNVGTLVVVDADERPIGILTDRDVALKVVGEGLSSYDIEVRDLMTPRPATVTVDLPVEDVLGHMRQAGVRRLPVVDAEGRLAGLVSVDDILGLLAGEFDELRGLLRGSSPQSLAAT
ncbi:MAG: CBS domain-containing protein [Planctomycetota bacterium]